MHAPLDTIHITEAHPHDPITREAAVILQGFAFANSPQARGNPTPKFLDDYLLAKHCDQPRIVLAGYSTGVMTCAATATEEISAPSSYDTEAMEPFYDLPYLAILLAATDINYRGEKHGRTLAQAAVELVRSHHLQRVQLWPANDKAQQFWGKCGFEAAPFEIDDEGYMVHLLGDTAVPTYQPTVYIDSTVTDRLDVINLIAESRRQSSLTAVG